MEFVLPLSKNIVRIHEIALQFSEGIAGILHPERLDAAVQRPRTYMAYDGECTIHVVCALLLSSIARDHIFTDGNKRTALLTMLITYQINDINLNYSWVMNERYTDLVLWVVNEKPDIKEIAIKLEELAEQFKQSLSQRMLGRLLGLAD